MPSLDATPKAQEPSLTHSVDHSENSLDGLANRLSETLERRKYVVLVVFSMAYFGVTIFLANRKLFWFDELFTVYLCRLPDMKLVWKALLSGVDFNPPLFYLLTRASEHLFGEGHIADRLPAIVGFWVFCLCLFRFVSVRLPLLSAFVSMLFPLVTGAYWYAYEARPHGIVLGFCGLALISWQGAADCKVRRRWWLVALGGSLSCALLTHSYGFLVFVPIFVGELSRSLNRKRLDWPIWFAIAASSLAVLASVPFVHRVLSEVGFAATLRKVLFLYAEFLTPAVSVIIGSFLLSSLVRKTRDPKNVSGFQHYEVMTLWAFVAIPIFEYLAAKSTGAPYFSRYGITTVAGFAGFFGAAVSRKATVAMGTLVLLLWQIVLTFFGFASDSVLREPSSGYAISTRMSQFNQRYTAMEASENENLPILQIDDLDFVPTAYYAPPTMASRLVYIEWTDEGVTAQQWFDRLRSCCDVTTKAFGLEQFLASHDTFLVYGRPASAYRLTKLIDKGAIVLEKKDLGDHFLLLMKYRQGTRKGAHP